MPAPTTTRCRLILSNRRRYAVCTTLRYATSPVTAGDVNHNSKVKPMKQTTLALAILFSLSGVTAVQAEAPPVTVQPLELEVVPAAVESAAQQVMEALPAAAATAADVPAQPEPPAAAQAAAADVTPATEPELPAAAPAAGAAPAEDTAAADAGTIDAQGEMAMPDATGDAAAASADTMPGKLPCPMHGMGKRGMGPGAMGMGGMKPGCEQRGMGMRARHQEVVDRLDMIEARMAKIEAMLESLMKREP